MNGNDPVALLAAALVGAVCCGPFLAAIMLGLMPGMSNLVHRVSRMEYKINLIAKQVGIDDLGDINPVLRELWNGNKINAIKLYREQTGVGLKAAKDVIDALERGDTTQLERGNGVA